MPARETMRLLLVLRDQAASRLRFGQQSSQAREAPQVLVQAGKSHGRGAQSRVIRVIGGAMRGRRWRFPDIPDIRPTPDRVRETLFNWLGPRVVGARCLDLFAGSGALGLESLSRGASGVVFVEQHAAIVRGLGEVIVEWNVQGAEVQRTDAFSYLRGTPQRFDIVFLDPPFSAGLVARAAALLEERGWLAPNALIYVECAAREARPVLPEAWQEHKAKQAGEVGYYLYARNPGGAVPE
jgi:16S rRNA (guanine966-N2)-methyltransferase